MLQGVRIRGCASIGLVHHDREPAEEDDPVQLLLRRSNPQASSTTPTIPKTSPPPTETGERPPLDRIGLVNGIMALNPTASEAYLGSFTDRSLTMYLAHLESAGTPRGTRWERPCDSPAIIGRESAE
ncbi:MAG: hypothetical protein Q9O74_09140 [Planctomycetota bacterium]|nr:hypothetical protein [Planctomycetota bacterium]